jgi:PncC family amidohydrolase
MDQETRLVAQCRESGVTLATAESCTGGMVAARITSVPGASAVFLGGVVSYADGVKRSLLNVPPDVLEREGAVSSGCAAAMAEGARRTLGADVSVAVTGIAGPAGGTPEKPVGLVWFAVATPDSVQTERRMFTGARDDVRRQAADHALTLLLAAASLPRR